jgi:hypothetical protein
MKFTDPEITNEISGKLSLKKSFTMRLSFLIIGIHGFLFPANTLSQLCEAIRASRNTKGFQDFIEMCDLLDNDMFS